MSPATRWILKICLVFVLSLGPYAQAASASAVFASSDHPMLWLNIPIRSSQQNPGIASGLTVPESPDTAAWYDGSPVYSQIVSCNLGYIEQGAAVYTGFSADPGTGQPYPGQVYYVHIVIYGLGNSCFGMYAWPEIKLPANTSLAISGVNPVRCYADGNLDNSGECPQNLPESIFHYGAYAIPSLTGYANTWPVPMGHYWEFQIPVVSSAALNNNTMTAFVHMIDGNDSPWLEAQVGVYVFSTEPKVLYPNPSTTEITETTAKSWATVVTGGKSGHLHFEIGPAAGNYTAGEDTETFSTNSTYWENWIGLPGGFSLQPGMIYHWRASFIATDGAYYYGIDQTFTTLPDGQVTVGNGTPASCTEAALNIALSTAKNITFDCGIMPITITLTTNKSIFRNVNIDGNHKITLSTNGSVKHFSVQNEGILYLDRMALINGNSTSCGGSIQVLAGGLLYMDGDILVKNNTSANGGAICVEASSSASVSNSVIRLNTADGNGGGFYNAGTLELFWSDISENKGTNGGGIENDGRLYFQTSLIYKNSTSSSGGTGGGINNHGSAEVYASTISANKGRVGGGISTNGTTLFLTGVTIVDNDTCFGPYYCDLYAPGGLDSTNSGGSVHLRNTLLANNIPGNCSNLTSHRYWTSDGYNLDSGNHCLLNGTGDLSNSNSRLGPLMDNGGPTRTHALGVGSPAIDTGSNTYCGAYDQRGFGNPALQSARQVDGDGDGSIVCDIGAYEARQRLFLPLLRR